MEDAVFSERMMGIEPSSSMAIQVEATAALSGPQVGFDLFPNVMKSLGRRSPEGNGIESDFALAEYLAEEAAGAMIGTSCVAPGYHRYSLAIEEEKLDGACICMPKTCLKQGS